MNLAPWPKVPRSDAVHRLFQAGVDPARQALTDLVGRVVELRERWQYVPAADSPAMAERAEERKFAGPSPWGEEPVAAAHNISALVLSAAEDHIKALSRLLDGPDTPTYSHIVLARSALEASARSLWLGEPEIGVRRRVGRYMTERAYSLDEQARIPTGGEYSDRARSRRQALLAEAGRQGYRKVHSRHSGTSIEERRLGGTRAIDWLLDRGAQSEDQRTALGEVVYRYFSAVAHGTLYGLSASFQRDDRIPRQGDQALGMLYVSSDGVRVVLGTVVLGYVEAAHGLMTLFGWANDDEYRNVRLAALKATR